MVMDVSAVKEMMMSVVCVCEGYKGEIVVMDVSAVKEMMMSVVCVRVTKET